MTTLQNITPADLPDILNLLHELGESEGVVAIRTTEAHLRAAFFGDGASVPPAAVCKHIVHQGRVAGFVVYSWKWATFTGLCEMYMQAIYIKPDFRRRGLARKAMADLAAIALERGCSRIEWLVVRHKALSNDFYDAIGARCVDHMAVRRLYEAELEALALAAQ